MQPGEGTGRCAVVGLGVMGACTLLALARAGVECVGYEKWPAGHPYGASGGGETRIFRSVSSAPDPLYSRLLARSREAWTRLSRADAGDVPLFDACGALTVGPDTDPRVAAAAARGTTTLAPADAAARWPAHRFDPGDRVVLDPGGGVLRAGRGVRAALAEARSLGAEIRTGTPVHSVTPVRGRTEIVSDAGADTVDAVVLATGRWAAHHDPSAAALVEMRRVVLSWFDVTAPDRFASDRFPPGQRYGTDESWSFFPSVDESTVKINMQRRQPEVPDPDAAPPPPAPGYVGDWAPAVTRRLHGLTRRAARLESHVECYTAHGRGMVRLVDDAPRTVSVAGFAGRGYKYAPAVGEIAAGLAAGRPVSEGFTDGPGA